MKEFHRRKKIPHYGTNQKIEALSKYYELDKLLKFEVEIPHYHL
ncbi:MAG: hypothetical protein ACTSRI_09585 [Promethearchaeota archaeon]